MYETLHVRRNESTCFVQIHRPEAGNALNAQCVLEFGRALQECETGTTVVVVEGLPDVFCLGADFREIRAATLAGGAASVDPALLYDVWLKLATGPYVTIAHVRGKANAGGMGFVAACDIVLAQSGALFSLSELLFGLYPACVLPFLIRRIGFQKAHYLTLLTQPITAQQAHTWGLVDVCDEQSEVTLRKHLVRLQRLSKPAIRQYKDYLGKLGGTLAESRLSAIEANRQVFSDRGNIAGIVRYVDRGLFPWEA